MKTPDRRRVERALLADAMDKEICSASVQVPPGRALMGYAQFPGSQKVSRRGNG